MTKKHIKPFDFSKLKKFSSRQMASVNVLLNRFPQFSEDDEIAPVLTGIFERDLGLNLSVKFSGFDEKNYLGFINSFSSPCVAVLLRAESADQNIVLEIDYSLCRRIIDKVLGGPGDYPKELIPLSPLEEGVLEYLLLKALSQLRDVPGMQGPSNLRVLKIASESKVLADASNHEELGCVFKFYLGVGEINGFLRIYFPHPLVEGLFLREDIMAGVIEPWQEDEIEKRLSRASHIKTMLWSEIGRVNLMTSEKSQLEKGDVILFDETFAGIGGHGLNGKTVLHVGDNSSEGLLAEVLDSEGKLVVKVLDYYGG